MTHRFSLGIDLGTSNSAIAVTDLESDTTELVEVAQVLRPGQIGDIATLPSALYVAHPDEFPADAFTLPWNESADRLVIIGQFARDHGALVPDRLVTSAKSWLSNPHIDPKDPALPWKSEIEEKKLSAFDCSRLYLQHIRDAFRHGEAAKAKGWELAEGQIVLTVPASFDDVARNLTAEAAEAAGLGKVTLLEEPQAAFYAWTQHAGKEWRTQVSPGDIVLVCDVGGGTADFSLIAVNETDGELELERISVGEHILLGGDNMDLALAYTLRAKLETEGKSLDAWQFLALVHAAAKAKVALFDDAALAAAPIAVPSRGSSLFAGTVATTLERSMLEQVILDGFFPKTAVSDMPREGRRVGLQEFGLPYAADAAVSRHLARFLSRSLANVKASEKLAALVGAAADAKDFLAPTAVLFNGGVFKAAVIRERILGLLTAWNDGKPVRELQGFQPDLAVAKGASVYGRNRATGKGIRIKAGAARSYYIGLESSMPTVPGFTPPVKAVCVVPQGMEEGSQLVIEGKEFGLITGHPAEFRFFSSEVRSGDTPGQILADAEGELEETSRLEVNLPTLDDLSTGPAVPVQINPVITELGTLELWMKHTKSDRRWKVEFTVRTE
ncbi:Hsp70 family protein [Defluviicoccus vanus]|uniref:Hsp70 family protein n=1 Tax=Defluviicoccus vanus TaxID=111831 RepID=A0A7H1N1Z2_9PROT|nr:Hsp70 family protein [Defluviicoccus vanus]QNT69728.1 Hsp70 family protein [Defluviicoccus vanus]